ncbi:MAG TPA: PASTA domain-containing protein [Actinomycetota bacterium]|nr:PASTA domain-containing protein [Actinomycetota bacterium]
MAALEPEPATDAGKPLPPPTAMAQPPADQFAGPLDRPDDYQLLELAQRGGEGLVWRASYRQDLPAPVEFALKQLVPPPGTAAPEWPPAAVVAGWNSQLKLAHLLQHPHMSSYQELFSGWPPHPEGAAGGELPETLRTWYLVMAWVEGPTLHELVSAGELPFTRRLECLVQLGEAVDYLHSGADTAGMALLHRDIKPGNVIVHPTRGAVLVDFGLAAVEASPGADLPAWTAAYLAPEAQADRSATSRASDVWAVAATGFFALTGDHPRPLEPEWMRRRLVENLAGRVDDPAAVAEIVMAALQADVPGRPPSAAGWARRLADAAGGTSVGLVPPAAVRRRLLRSPWATPPPGRAEPRVKGSWAPRVLMLVLPVLAALVAPLLLFGSIPAVGSLPAAQAVRTLERAGFKPAKTYQASDQVAAGLAIGTQPDAGAFARRGSRVRLFLSAGPHPITVPEVVGLEAQAAGAQLLAAGFVVRQATQPSDRPVGEVIATDPPGGSLGARGFVVTIMSSAGRSPTAGPPANGLQALGPQVAASSRAATEGGPAPRSAGLQTVAQDQSPLPAPGPTVAGGQHVLPSPSAGAPPASTSPSPQVTVPSCSGLPAKACAGALTQAGLGVVQVDDASKTVQAGKVIGTAPPAGAQAALPAAVTMHVSSGPSLTGFATSLVPGPGAYLDAVTAGPDGNLWLTDADTGLPNSIVRVTPVGVATAFALPTANGNPSDITAGPDGNLWFTEWTGNAIGRVTPDGLVKEFPIPTPGSNPSDITAGPDGNLWFTEWSAGRIGRITKVGAVTEFPLPAAGRQPSGISGGADGNLWFTEEGGGNIGRITPSGAITEFPLPAPDSGPRGITAGADGNLWFAEQAAGRIGRISTAGALFEFAVPTAGAQPYGVVAGIGGTIWFTESAANRIGRVTPDGNVLEAPIPAAASYPVGITSGPDGDIWFAERGARALSRAVLGP